MAENASLYLLFDILVMLTLLLLEIAFVVAISGTRQGLWPVKRGFFCDDQSIQMPLREYTVDYVIILCVGFITVIGTILIYEIGDWYFHWKGDAESTDEGNEKIGPISLSPWIIRMISSIVIFVTAALVLMVLVDLLKLASGSLRPNFLAVCQPDARSYDCNEGYITKTICTGDSLQVKFARLSFPSKSTAVSMFFTLYYAFYIQAIVVVDAKLLKPLIQVVVVSLALFVGVSVVTDYHHHAVDAIAGAILGAFFAWFTAFKISKLFAIKIRKPRVYTLVSQTPNSKSTE